jgi:hypothetical protein
MTIHALRSTTYDRTTAMPAGMAVQRNSTTSCHPPFHHISTCHTDQPRPGSCGKPPIRMVTDQLGIGDPPGSRGTGDRQRRRFSTACILHDHLCWVCWNAPEQTWSHNASPVCPPCRRRSPAPSRADRDRREPTHDPRSVMRRGDAGCLQRRHAPSRQSRSDAT